MLEDSNLLHAIQEVATKIGMRGKEEDELAEHLICLYEPKQQTATLLSQTILKYFRLSQSASDLPPLLLSLPGKIFTLWASRMLRPFTKAIINPVVEKIAERANDLMKTEVQVEVAKTVLAAMLEGFDTAPEYVFPTLLN